MQTTTTFRRMPLLTTNNVKTMKGSKLGYLTYILYMSPFNLNSKGINVCSHASKGCASACLVDSGFGGLYTAVNDGRRNRTEYFLQDRVGFLNQLVTEIETAIRRNKGKAKVTIRLNGTSDIRYEKFKIKDNKNIFELFPNIQFYDYTKNHIRFETSLPKNYHLTFSRHETNNDKAMELLNKGVNVAMVFDKVPKKFNDFKVVNGDETDLRFLDKKGVVVGLRYKKLTKKDSDNTIAFTSGFAIAV